MLLTKPAPTEREREAALLLAEAEQEAAKKVTVIGLQTTADSLPNPDPTPAPLPRVLPLVNGAAPSQSVAFVHYKAAQGQAGWAVYASLSAAYQQRRESLKLLVERLQSERAWLVEHRRVRVDGDVVLSEAEYEAWLAWRERKRAYKEDDAERQKLQAEADAIRAQLESAQKDLVDGFTAWYREVCGSAEKEDGATKRGRSDTKGWWEQSDASSKQLAETQQEEKEAPIAESVQPSVAAISASVDTLAAGR